MPATETMRVYTDGASRGNPGPAAIGYVILDKAGELIERNARNVGKRTNNEAEYEALLLAMDRVLTLGFDRAEFFSDSELMVRQINGRYRTKNERLKVLADMVKAKKAEFASFKLTHVVRENRGTQLADAIVNEALDRAGF